MHMHSHSNAHISRNHNNYNKPVKAPVTLMHYRNTCIALGACWEGEYNTRPCAISRSALTLVYIPVAESRATRSTTSSFNFIQLFYTCFCSFFIALSIIHQCHLTWFVVVSCPAPPMQKGEKVWWRGSLRLLFEYLYAWGAIKADK